MCFFYNTYRDYANQLLCLFVQHFGQLYGEDQYVYNIHGLTHLAGDVSNFGVLDDYSGFALRVFWGK